MNQNGDEKRIQQLFREMSRDDELRVPAFSRVVHGGSSRVAPFRVSLSRRLALAFAILCVAVIAIAMVTLRHQGPAAPNDQVTAKGQPPEASPMPIPLADIPVNRPLVSLAPVKRAVIHVRHHRPVNELALAMRLSTWRSPTSSLLTTTSDDKLMSLPKLGESLQTLRFYSLDDLN